MGMFLGAFQPIYMATLFVLFLQSCAWLLDRTVLTTPALMLVWLGAFATHLLDAAGIWSPEDWINQSDRPRALYNYRKPIFILTLFLMMVSGLGLYALMINKTVYLVGACVSAVAFFWYTGALSILGTRLKKLKYV